VAGQFPVWRQQNDGRSTWYGANALPPYEGQIGKTLLYIDKQIQGDLRLSGHQLDGDGVVLFGGHAKQVVDDQGNVLGVRFVEGRNRPAFC